MSTEPLAPVTIYTDRTTCRSCNAAALESVLDLGSQYLVRFPDEKDEGLPRAPLQLVRCENCGLLQLGASVNPDLLYREFHYRSGINQTMRDALQDVVDDATEYHTSGVWLDIGANDGFLLSCVPKGFERVACEPALNFKDELKEHADVVVADYFSGSHAEMQGPFDVITSAACFYDVSEPDEFVGAIARILSPDGVWLNQLNDSPGMLKQNAFDSVCHEHLCYYDIPNLKAMYSRNGLAITNVSFNDVNGGSVRITAKLKRRSVTTADLAGLKTPTWEQCVQFAKRTARWKEKIRDVLFGLSCRGPIYGAGASTKGAVLLQYLDEPHLIAAIGDRNDLKHGKVMVGLWTPIVSEGVMRDAKPAAVLVMPWAFETEITRREKKLIESGTALVYPLPNIKVSV